MSNPHPAINTVTCTLCTHRSSKQYFPSLDSSHSIHQLSTSWMSISIFLYLSSFPSLSSVVLYLSDYGHVTDVYKTTALSFPLRHVRKRTNQPTPFNTCLRSRNFSTCRRAPGVGHESTGLWKGVTGSSALTATAPALTCSFCAS